MLNVAFKTVAVESVVLFQREGEEIYRIGLVELGKRRWTSLRYTQCIMPYRISNIRLHRISQLIVNTTELILKADMLTLCIFKIMDKTLNNCVK